MNNETTLYTGTMKFRDLDFIFTLKNDELNLIPTPDNLYVVFEWLYHHSESESAENSNPMIVTERYLSGFCNETQANIVFVLRSQYMHMKNNLIILNLAAYIVFKGALTTGICKMRFSCPEINYIHPTRQALSLTLDEQDVQGVFSLQTQSFANTTTEKQSFEVDKKEVNVYFDISRTVNYKDDKPPLELKSCLILEFESTNDYSFIFKLWNITREFIRFLCYRKNISIPSVALYRPYDEKRQAQCGTMYFVEQPMVYETKPLQKGCFIKQMYIAGHEGQILSDIAAGNIYLRHFPETYRLGHITDAARFIMITAAFEWEFRRLYPDGLEKSEDRINAEAEVTGALEQLINDSKGKVKSIYKKLKRNISFDTLEYKIVHTGTDYSEIIDIFAKGMYSYNNEKFDYREIAQRLSSQRNNFAHGNIDKDFDTPALLDLVYLKYLVYAMQLKYYGVDDINIQKAINELFCCRVVVS